MFGDKVQFTGKGSPTHTHCCCTICLIQKLLDIDLLFIPFWARACLILTLWSSGPSGPFGPSWRKALVLIDTLQSLDLRRPSEHFGIMAPSEPSFCKFPRIRWLSGTYACCPVKPLMMVLSKIDKSASDSKTRGVSVNRESLLAETLTGWRLRVKDDQTETRRTSAGSKTLGRPHHLPPPMETSVINVSPVDIDTNYKIHFPRFDS